MAVRVTGAAVGRNRSGSYIGARKRLHEGGHELRRDLRDDGIAVTAQSSHTGGASRPEWEANLGIRCDGLTPSLMCIACQKW